MIKSEFFFTRSLLESPHGSKITRILSAAINAVDPYQAVQTHLGVDDNSLYIDQQVYSLDTIGRILIIAIGKASVPMTLAAKNVLGSLLTSALTITKTTPPYSLNLEPSITLCQASHPIPDQKSVNCTKEAVNRLTDLTKNDLVIFLLSGGGSALLTLPAEGVLLEDIQSITSILLRSGATIKEINCIRKHLSQVKGGGLAHKASPAKVVSLILSDVINDPVDVIASGPTAPDTSTFIDAKNILSRYNLINKTPKSILDRIDQGIEGIFEETPKENDPVFENVKNIIIGNNYLAASAAKQQAELEGLNTLLLSSSIQGEASCLGHFFSAIAQQVSSSEEPIRRPACIIAGGETTVTISGDGLGGRNQELALSTVEGFANLGDMIFVSLATDGEDGPTDAAGAVVTASSFNRAKESGLDPKKFLSNNNSYQFFESLGDLIKIGPTDTNVCDLAFIFAF